MPQIEIPVDKLAGEPFSNYGILEDHYIKATIGVDDHPPEQHYRGHFVVWLKRVDSKPDFMKGYEFLDNCIEDWMDDNDEWVQEELAYQQSKRG